ncbi:hypothetical protein HRK28_04625 [Rathayibacter sp. VKM Ac-2835]|uniref:hypothetical protein n=1 Tax=Rathayibacter sp. VKM Ac-2835 TaxID=2739043 RepID=UPI001565773A|nr:hypothetical protein [Rathayibacter sp. VKM Ac-2835]NRG40199.1 hypothetical protein [Rathayibacter sp. VKM Ac-2835]
MTTTVTSSSGETIRASTRAGTTGAQEVTLWTARFALALTPDEARAVSVALLDQALRAERATDDDWLADPMEVPC